MNASADLGWTPLHQAARGGDKDIVGYLISKGADVNARSKDGWTPLEYAARNGHTEVAQLLWQYGARR